MIGAGERSPVRPASSPACTWKGVQWW